MANTKKKKCCKCKIISITVKLSELSCVMPPQFRIMYAKLAKPVSCNEYVALFCVTNSFILVKPSTRSNIIIKRQLQLVR